MTNNSQKQFEAFALSAAGGLGQGHLVKGEDGEYLNDAARSYWEFWEGSRGVLVVELPQQSGANLDWNQAIRYCHQAIEAAGLKVKP